MVIPEMIGYTFDVHNGRKFISVFNYGEYGGPLPGRIFSYPFVQRTSEEIKRRDHEYGKSDYKIFKNISSKARLAAG